MSAGVVLLTAVSVQAKPVVVAGNLMTSDTQGAVYEISSDGTKNILTNPQYATSYAASGGGCYNNGKYYMSKIWMSGYSSQTYVFDTSEVPWKTLNTDGDGSSSVLSTDYSYDDEGGVIYAFIKASGSNYKIGKITPGSSWSTRYVQVQVGTDMKDVTIDCSNAENKWHGIAFDSENQLWVITFGGVLNRVNKDTGEMTLVGETGVKPTVNGSAAFDFKTGKLYWAVKNADGSAVYEVNTTTAETTKVMDVPDNLQLMGLFVPEPAADDAAPAAPVNVRYDFSGGSLEGSVMFDIPQTTFDEKPAEGEISYSVTINDREPVSGTAAYGQNGVSVPFSVAGSGEVIASIYLENAVGKSPVVKYEGYVGFGTPEPPSNVALTYTDGKMVVTWDAVDGVVDNLGYLGDVKYNVVRSSNGVPETVAEGVETTGFEQEIAEPETGLATYSYSVTAINGDKISASVSSPSWTLGSIALPYVNDFTNEEDFSSMTVINCEPGSKTWTWVKSSGCVSIAYDKAYVKDDWLISPPFKIEKDCRYIVSIDAKSQNSRYPEKVGIAWGTEPTAEGMSDVLVAGDEDVPTTYTTYSGGFVAKEDGLAYAGVHACSAADMSTLQIDNFKIEKDIYTGLKEVSANDAMSVSVKGQEISVKGKGHVAIIAIDGSTIVNADSDGEISVSVASGVYVVTVNTISVKTIVK